MTLLWCEGFEGDLADATTLARKYENTANHNGTNAGRWIGNSARSSASVPGLRFRTPDLGNKSTFFIGFNFNDGGSGVTVAAQKLLTVMNGTTEQISLWVERASTGKIKWTIKRGSTTLGTTTNSWASGWWAFIEFKVIFDTTGSNGTVELKVNEISELLIENTDTTNDAATTGNKVEFTHMHLSSAASLDDIYICDSLGSLNNTYLGEVVVEGRSPNAAGNRNQWTISSGSSPHHDYVNDTAINDDTDYLFVQNTSDGQVELFGTADLSAVVAPIHGVMVTFDLRMDTSGTDKVRPIFRNGSAVEATGAEKTINAITYTKFYEIFEQDPTITAAWTVANFNAMQVGLESRP